MHATLRKIFAPILDIFEQGDGSGAFIPVVVFFAVSLVCLVVGGLGTERAAALTALAVTADVKLTTYRRTVST